MARKPARRYARPRELSLSQLELLLRNVRRATAVSLVARTQPVMRVRGNPYRDNLVKIARVNGLIGIDYRSCIDRQRQREATEAGTEPETYTTGHLHVRSRIEGTVLFGYRDKVVLPVKVERVIETQYRTIDTDELVPVELVTPWLKKRQPGSKRQGVNRQVVLRDYPLTSIIELRIFGDVFRVEENEPQQLAAAA